MQIVWGFRLFRLELVGVLARLLSFTDLVVDAIVCELELVGVFGPVEVDGFSLVVDCQS